MSAPELRPSPLLPTPDLRRQTVLVPHARPDDEAIFTGLTRRRLADAGARTVLVVATDGDLGGSRVPLRRGETVRQRRRAELEQGAGMLGVARLVLLGQRDPGLPRRRSGAPPPALAAPGPPAPAPRGARPAHA